MTALLVAASAGIFVAQIDNSVLTTEFPRMTREWSDSTGEYRVTAKLVSMTETAVVLEKENKKVITVPLTRLDKTSRDLANEAYPHFLVEKKIHDIIEKSIDPEVEIKNRANLPRILIERANGELRTLIIKTRYRITEVTKPKPGKVKVRFERLYNWRVIPDSWKTVGVGPHLGYLSGWNFEADEIGTTEIVANKTIFEMSGMPQLVFPGARDFSFYGVGMSKEADRRKVGPTAVQIGFAVMKHKIRVITP